MLHVTRSVYSLGWQGCGQDLHNTPPSRACWLQMAAPSSPRLARGGVAGRAIDVNVQVAVRCRCLVPLETSAGAISIVEVDEGAGAVEVRWLMWWGLARVARFCAVSWRSTLQLCARTGVLLLPRAGVAIPNPGPGLAGRRDDQEVLL